MWSKVSSKPDLVGEREGHCSCLLSVGDSQLLVVLGGFCEGEFRREVVAAVLDDVSLEWFVAGEYDFCETDGMSMSTQLNLRNVSLTPNEAVLFGGLESSSYAPVNIVRRLSIELVGDAYVTSAIEVAAAGKPPSPRWRHSASIVSNHLYIFGGITSERNQNSDLFRFELSLGIWEEVEISVVPPPRFLAVLLPLSSEYLVLHGGACFDNGEQASLCDVWTLNLSELQWEELLVTGWPRVNGHCGFVRMVRDSLAEVYYHGGKDFAEGTDDILKLTLSVGEHPQVAETVRMAVEGAPHWRYTASSAVTTVQNNCVMFFVIGGQCRHNDVTSTYRLLL